jgi:hypothetical protein
MIKKGIISGKVLKGSNPEQLNVTHGPNTHKVHKHPVDDLIDKSIGKTAEWFEPNGSVIIPTEKIEYLKS